MSKDPAAPGALVYGVLGWGEAEKAKPMWHDLIRCRAINFFQTGLARL